MHVKCIHIGMHVVYHLPPGFRRARFEPRGRLTTSRSNKAAAGHPVRQFFFATEGSLAKMPKPALFRSGRLNRARNRASQSSSAVAPPRSTLAEQVYQQLRFDIIHGVFQAGEAINEKVLAKRYHGSRTPVREAVMRLQQENLLRLVPNKGYFVGHITIHELNEMYEYRAELEGFCAELAARRWADTALMEQLTEFAGTQYRTDDRASYERFIEADTEFHVGIARLTRNRLVLRAIREVRCQMERIMFAAIDIGYYGEVPAREHTEILAAVQRRDPGAARKLMYEHIVGSKDKVLQLAAGRPLAE
jgi:DNA-binding GntR family transcriptional regulator